jgi:hypothetical protein
MPSPLENLAGPGQALRKEPPDAREFARLRQAGLRRLADAQNSANALESQFDLAYSAGHALSLAALRRAGYRATNRYIVFQTLPHTLGVGPDVWRVLDKCHGLRNRGDYEGDLDVDERLVADLIHACKAVAAASVHKPRGVDFFVSRDSSDVRVWRSTASPSDSCSRRALRDIPTEGG